MDSTAMALEAETRKWLEKLEEETKKIKISEGGKAPEKKVNENLANVQAYISDCRHFLEKRDFIRAFEAAVYAWGIFETLERIGLVKE